MRLTHILLLNAGHLAPNPAVPDSVNLLLCLHIKHVVLPEWAPHIIISIYCASSATFVFVLTIDLFHFGGEVSRWLVVGAPLEVGLIV